MLKKLYFLATCSAMDAFLYQLGKDSKSPIEKMIIQLAKISL